MHRNLRSRIATYVVALAMLFTGGMASAAPAAAAEKSRVERLAAIALKVAQYANCDRLPLLERPRCLKEFAGKAVKLGAGVVLFLFVTQDAMKDHGASFKEFDKNLKALEALKPLDLVDPTTVPDPAQQLKLLEQAVKTFKSAKPHLDKLGTNLAKADDLLGDQSGSLLTLTLLTVALGDYFPDYTPPKYPDAEPIFDFEKDLAELNAAFDQMNEGFAQMDRGLREMNAGVAEVNSGLSQANKGISKANKGMKEMNEGVAQANKGVKEANKHVPGIKKGAEKLRDMPGIDFDFSHIGDTWGAGSSGLDEAEQQRRMSLLLDLLPGVGDGKGVVEAIVGKDVVTGQKLGTKERVLGGLSVLHWLRAGDRLLTAEDVKKARKGEEAVTCNSFPGGTAVVMADGSRLPIDQVQVGDQVLASDPESGLTQAEPVTAHITGQGQKNLVDVTIRTDDGTTTVTATEGHPFWVDDLEAWATAQQLEPGGWLRTSAGTRVQISAVRSWTDQDRTVHNLTVANLHTFYVLAGGTPLLVHNANGCGVWKSGFDALPKGKQPHVKEMSSVAEMRGAFDQWTAGAQRLPARGPKIPDVYKLADGTVIQWRTSSRSGGETIDIFPVTGKGMKVHLPDGQ
ncbi:X-X-X-Leu-X-X-Gly heptad repeat-containing protein [Streptomyces sp. OV198]|jgi:X-X-X-Leu-X-X-Gly heptad repeat protein|uniref:polymorphic toxin-type HINT domain-containing protein n=1 Tax=Streptomyces sp. OV198 TaxID=1882787 RepID=UPI000BCC6F03|nr:polymorphic toxin-type HINT domain-containing protein [Streptomyces sp. OV198]SOE47767.1 X-X-X-Leu-X-X-Gly heptad repeat-containing protein [Streptomyces sp. OV198]